jgi:hypothetical protein
VVEASRFYQLHQSFGEAFSGMKAIVKPLPSLALHLLLDFEHGLKPSRRGWSGMILGGGEFRIEAGGQACS